MPPPRRPPCRSVATPTARRAGAGYTSGCASAGVGNTKKPRILISQSPGPGHGQAGLCAVARLWFYRRDTAVVKLLTGFSFISPVFARGGATRGPLHPLRGCPRAWALEWERWIRLRWLFGDSNTVVSSRWGLGGLRHFSGALRPFRHSSRGLPSGSAIWCPSSLRCAGAHYSGFVGRASSMWLPGEYGIFLFCSPRFWVVGVFLRALSSSGG